MFELYISRPNQSQATAKEGHQNIKMLSLAMSNQAVEKPSGLRCISFPVCLLAYFNMSVHSINLVSVNLNWMTGLTGWLTG